MFCKLPVCANTDHNRTCRGSFMIVFHLQVDCFITTFDSGHLHQHTFCQVSICKSIKIKKYNMQITFSLIIYIFNMVSKSCILSFCTRSIIIIIIQIINNTTRGQVNLVKNVLIIFNLSLFAKTGRLGKISKKQP